MVGCLFLYMKCYSNTDILIHLRIPCVCSSTMRHCIVMIEKIRPMKLHIYTTWPFKKYSGGGKSLCVILSFRCTGVGRQGKDFPCGASTQTYSPELWVFQLLRATGFLREGESTGLLPFYWPNTYCKGSSRHHQESSTNISFGLRERRQRMGLTVKGILLFPFQSLHCFEDPNTERRSFHYFLMFFPPRVNDQLYFPLQKIYK